MHYAGLPSIRRPLTAIIAQSQHHPISVSAYYEDQKEEAKRRAVSLRTERLPKFLGYFAAVIRANGGGKSGLLVGDKVTYADLALFQIVDGLRFAYPRAVKRFEASGEYNEVFQLEKLVRESKAIAEYLKSDRRLPYSQGIFVSTPFMSLALIWYHL